MSATSTKDTHIDFVTHILCIFVTDTHKQDGAGKLRLMPAPHTLNCRERFVHSLAGQLLNTERGTGGRGKMETERKRNITKSSRPRQIERRR